MSKKRELPKEYAVFQEQRWMVGDDGKYFYTGFRCPNDCSNCPLRKADHLDDDVALAELRGLYELHHIDGARFSKTGTCYPWQLIMLCIDCHALAHWDDPSASRKKWDKS